MENLLIEIGANTKEFLTGLSEVGESTKTLDDQLKGIGTASAVAFAGFTASIMGSVYAYGEQEKVQRQVNDLLYATGGISGQTSESLKELAESLHQTTGASDNQIASAELMLLSFNRISGETFPAATEASIALAKHMGVDAASAAKLLGMALEDPENALKRLSRQGIIFTDQQKAQITAMVEAGNAAAAQKLILDQVTGTYGKLAHDTGGVNNSVKMLKDSMEVFSEQIGARFAPYVESAAIALKNMFEWASKNQPIVELTANVLLAGAAVTGFIAAAATGVLVIRNVASALGVATTAAEAFGLSAKVAMGATGVGLILVVGLEIYQHWQVLWPAMQELFQNFVRTVTQAGQGLGKVLHGIFHLNMDEIKAGIAQAGAAFVEAAKKTSATVSSVFATTDSERKVAAESGKEIGNAEAKARATALRNAQTQLDIARGQARRAANAAETLEETGHTAKLVSLAKERAKILSTLADANYQGDKAKLRTHLSEITAEYLHASMNEQKQEEKFQKLTDKSRSKFTTQEHAKLVASIQTDEDAKKANDTDDLSRQIAADNLFLQEQDRYGTAYAELNQFMHSKVLQGANSAFGEMAQMTQSSNETLKGIGKAASAFNIAVKTIESAENIFAGFSTIPIIGPALGIAGAAAAMAFGLENEQKVLSMASGGLVTGGIAGVDSVPMLAQQGELIVPHQNFEEVINTVAKNRNGINGQSQQVEVVVSFKGNAARYLQVQTVQDKAQGTFRG